MSRRQPILQTAAIIDLRPTQVTVGYREVERKRRRWREQTEEDGPRPLGLDMIPVIRGPKGRYFVLDRHHFARALHEEGVEVVAVSIVEDLSMLSQRGFWAICGERGWCHPYDAAGIRRPMSDIPKTVSLLADDPFRSLAGALRRAGGFTKKATPFSEFAWADFLRERIEHEWLASDFEGALGQALDLATRTAARDLPGWTPCQGRTPIKIRPSTSQHAAL